MPINRDVSDLPQQPEQPEQGGGRKPDAEPSLMPLLAQAWYDASMREEDKPTAVPGVRYRGSEAGSCARAIAYSIQRRDVLNAHREWVEAPGQATPQEGALWEVTLDAVERTNPPEIDAHWRMGLGTMVHEQLQEVITSTFPNAEAEVAVDLRPDLDGACSVDLWDGETVTEIKTRNGYGFKKDVGAVGQPDGPQTNHVIQAALAARKLGAKRVVVGYLSLECLSPQYAAKAGVKTAIGRFAAEWTFEPDEFVPLAEAEIRRANAIIERLDAGGPVSVPRHAPREMPNGAQVTDPSKGTWILQDENGVGIKSGSYWKCAGYCEWQKRCCSDGPAPVTITKKAP